MSIVVSQGMGWDGMGWDGMGCISNAWGCSVYMQCVCRELEISGTIVAQ